MLNGCKTCEPWRQRDGVTQSCRERHVLATLSLRQDPFLLRALYPQSSSQWTIF
jgi:hypothetical protein